MSMCSRRKPRPRGESGELRPLRVGHQKLRTGQSGDPADVVLMQMGDERGIHVGGGVSQRSKLRLERLVRTDANLASRS